MALPALTDLLRQAGISWVKYPLWCSEQDGGRQLEELIDFAEKLNARGNRIGRHVAGAAGTGSRKIRRNRPLKAAEVFAADPKIWYPSLEPVIIQLSNKVRYWQLGRDTDLSLLVVPNFFEKLKAIRAELERGMQGMQLGIGWDCAAESAHRDRCGWICPGTLFRSRPIRRWTSRELGAYLDAAAVSPLKSWVVLTPLPRGEYPLPARAEDLVRRMVAAKIHGAAAAFCPDPFDPKCGLMNPDGTPGELFMPWRTTALGRSAERNTSAK